VYEIDLATSHRQAIPDSSCQKTSYWLQACHCTFARCSAGLVLRPVITAWCCSCIR